jgi:N-(2-amino-2-carboxyethyl)-L-glutamate synthase
MTWPDMYQGYDLTAVAIAPDLGERHLDTVYQENWLRDLYGEDVLDAEGVTADPRPA